MVIKNKNNELAKLVQDWKNQHEMYSYTLEDFVEEYKGDNFFLTYKVDGELTGFHYKNGKTILSTKSGILKTDFIISKELEKLLADYTEVIGIGELYAVDENGKMLPYTKSASIIRKPSPETENQLRYLIFDIFSINGKKIKDTVENKVDTINNIFKNSIYIQPLKFKESNIDDLEKEWEKVEQGTYEGFVIIDKDNNYIKIKPILTFDLAVIFVEISNTHPDMMGALGLAFKDKNDNFYFAGKVGTGFSQKDRIQWLNIAKKDKIKQEDSIIWIYPSYVVEVESMGINSRETEVYDTGLNFIKKDIGYILRQPRFKQIREDKSPLNKEDVRISQVPGYKYSTLKSTLIKNSFWIKYSKER